MSDRHRHWVGRLSEYLDETMHAGEREELEEHLAQCSECRELLEQLRAVVMRAGDLGDLEPPSDLWPGVAMAIGGPEPSDVIALPTAPPREAPDPGRWHVTLSPSQLVAASIALVVVSATATVWLLGTPGTGPAPPAPPAVGIPALTTDVGQPPQSLAAELSELEVALQAARDVLDPNTVRILERNLGMIEQAIADSRGALLLDPGNEFLTRHLERAYQRKLTYLREAAQIVDWSS